MKRFSTLISICSILFVSCDDGTKYVEGQLKQHNYSEIINFVKTNEGEWSKKSGVKLALLGLSKDFYNDVQVRQFFETEIYEGSSESIQEYGIRAIISNCDTTSIEKIFKQIAQTSNQDNVAINNHIQETIMGYDGKVCSDVEWMVADFKENFVRANAKIDSLESEIFAVTTSMESIQGELDYINSDISELKRTKVSKKCFFILAKHESNQYEARIVQDLLTETISWQYDQYNLKGTTKLAESPHVFEQKSVILSSSSGKIEGKGLYCLDVSLIDNIDVTTDGGFTAKWNVYREEDIEKYNARRAGLLSQAGLVSMKLSRKRSNINKIKFEIDSYNEKIAKYSSLENGVKPNLDDKISPVSGVNNYTLDYKLTEDEKTVLLKSVSRIPMPPVSRDEVAVIETDFGRIVFTFDLDNAPIHASNFKRLVYVNYYNGTTFHRVISGFMIQGGDINSRDSDPSNDGMGGPGYTIEAEIHNSHRKGAVAAARIGGPTNPERRSSGSQFYICHVDIPHLDGEYTVFGQVIEGMDVVDMIAEVNTGPGDKPVEDVVMNKVYITRMSEL